MILSKKGGEQYESMEAFSSTTITNAKTKILLALKDGLKRFFSFYHLGGSNMSDDDEKDDDDDERDFDYSDLHPDETVKEFEDHEDHDYD